MIQLKQILNIYLHDLIFWGVITLYRNYKKKDIYFLRNNYFKLRKININGWTIFHLMSYSIKGYKYRKNKIIILFLSGLLFEIIEYIIENKTNIKYVDSKILTDPFINLFGYLTGMFFYFFINF